MTLSTTRRGGERAVRKYARKEKWRDGRRNRARENQSARSSAEVLKDSMYAQEISTSLEERRSRFL